MAGKQSQRQRRLGLFLLNFLENGKIHGLKWHDPNQRLFTISWIDKRGTAREKVENPIFKEWEIFNKRYQSGEKEDWVKWKSTFRAALNKSPDVHEVPDQHQLNNKSNSYKMFRLDESVRRKKLQISPSHTADNNINHFSPNTQQPSKQPLGNLISDQNIPVVVTDVLVNPNTWLETTTTCKITSQEENTPIQCETQRVTEMPISESCYIGQCEVQVAHVLWSSKKRIDSFNTANNLDYYRINSEDFNEMFRPTSSEQTGSLPSFNTPDISLDSGKPYAEPDRPVARFQLYYTGIPVLKGSIGPKGVCLYHGICNNPKNVINVSEDCDPVEFPRLPYNYKEISEKSSHYINSALAGMSKGLLLYSRDRKLLAFRSCRTCIFSWNNLTGPLVLNRKNRKEQELFDMVDFEKHLYLHQIDPLSYKCPSSKIFLTVGEGFSFEKMVNKDQVMYMEFTVLEAEELLLRENRPPQDPLLSRLDTDEEWMQKFDQTMSF